MNSLVEFIKYHLLTIYKDRDYIPIKSQLLLELAERIDFLEVRQTELQEEGTKLVTERRELKSTIEKLQEEIKELHERIRSR